MLAILLHMMEGMPFIDQGEEIGMTNYPIQQIDQAQDIESLNLYEEKLAEGWTEAEIMEAINAKGRDNARTPMQWTAEQNGGFTDGEPWMTVNPNTSDINVQAAVNDEQSVFYTYQKLIHLRKEHPIIVKSTFKLLLKDHPHIFAYEREFEGET
ncbi:oligo-1,6-glucosidase/glucan 1,6-alpha-glucosidase [Alkalibacterium thalassium]|uniref:Oligo-1,6-glucosidase/glucan 1,6-alpha-glucosidase n=1 Tax=Alkalibacterium thalassium TaxID=426701 RepID=A0A1G9C917_9LACT|nr:oligo-1,6-glucosidase/glucan 1,6-alpha-glucosidase [Alkalibacterium thalassium]